MITDLSIVITVVPPTIFMRRESVIGTEKTANPFANMVITRACAMFPPAAPVITTPLLKVVGIAATRKNPIMTPVLNGNIPHNVEIKGAIKKIIASVIRVPFISANPDFICPAFNIRPEKKNIIIITTSGPRCILNHLPTPETVSDVSARVKVKTIKSPAINQYFCIKLSIIPDRYKISSLILKCL